MSALLEISNLSAKVAGKNVLQGLSLTLNAGEVHAIMGPNGSGKSTLSYVLAGRPGYEITGGTVKFQGRDLLSMEPEERARAGMFLGFQYPVEIPGVNNVYLLKAAVNAKRKASGLPEVDAYEFLQLVRGKMKLMQMDESFLSRGVNEGFSGGEKKRNEILQMLVLEPTLAVLGFHAEQIAPLEFHGATGDLITRASGEHVSERALARTIRAHDGVHFARVQCERQALQYILAADLGGQIRNFEQRSHPTAPSRLTANKFCASTANSIGNSLSTVLQKPLTIMFTASSSSMPRCRQ